MTIVFRPRDLFEKNLEQALLAPPSAVALGEEIPVRSAVEFTSEDQRIVSGVWEANPGLSRWEFTDRGEVIHVLEGAMSVTHDDGDPVLLEAGAAAVFPIGWTGTWEIHERIRKFFVVFRP